MFYPSGILNCSVAPVLPCDLPYLLAFIKLNDDIMAAEHASPPDVMINLCLWFLPSAERWCSSLGGCFCTPWFHPQLTNWQSRWTSMFCLKTCVKCLSPDQWSFKGSVGATILLGCTVTQLEGKSLLSLSFFICSFTTTCGRQWCRAIGCWSVHHGGRSSVQTSL